MFSEPPLARLANLRSLALARRHSRRVDIADAEDWIRAHVEPVGTIKTVHERPWATVLRVPIPGGVAWFKACAPVQAFEPRLTAELFARYPDRVAEVLGGLGDEFALAMRVGTLGHAIAWLRKRDHLPPKERAEFDKWFPIVLRRAIAKTL